MVAVWLYSDDGRAEFCVFVVVPMPLIVSFGGGTYRWDGSCYRRRKYNPEAVQSQLPEATYDATAEVPEADRPKPI